MIPMKKWELKSRSSKLERARDGMGGKFHARNGSHPIQKLVRMVRESLPTKTAADKLLVITRQSLVIAGLAGHSDSENLIASVVYGNDVSLPRWRDTSETVCLAYAIAAEMKLRRSDNQPHSQSYVAISLNLSEEDAKLTPDELKDSIRKRLYRALGLNIPFVLELDGFGRTHCHAIYFGYSLTPNQRHKLKAAGGEWKGTDSRKQLVAKERNSFENAIGWACWYMLKDRKEGAVLYIPNRMRSAGRELYEQTRQQVEKSTSQANKSEAGNADSDTPAKMKVLEKMSPTVSEREETDTAISKSGNARTQLMPSMAHQTQPKAIEERRTEKLKSTSYDSSESLSISFVRNSRFLTRSLGDILLEYNTQQYTRSTGRIRSQNRPE